MVRVTRADAARELGLNRSTLTRWCGKHPSLVDDQGLVSVEELREHRQTVVNPALQTRGGEGAAGQGQSASETAMSNLNTDRARRERSRADLEELQLAEKMGQTLRRDGVEAALQGAAETIRQTGTQIVRDNAEKLARMDDARAVEVHLDEMMRQLQARASAALMAAVETEADAHAA